MKYSEMVKEAIASGKGEAAMWKSVEDVNRLLEHVKECDPHEYWRFLRNVHKSLYGAHYNKEYAEYDVSQLTATDKQGNERKGAYWTMDDLRAATAGLQFPKGVTEWDIYVGYNICASDFCKEFDDEEILRIAYAFFFADEDWTPQGCATKVWDYVCAKQRANRITK